MATPNSSPGFSSRWSNHKRILIRLQTVCIATFIVMAIQPATQADTATEKQADTIAAAHYRGDSFHSLQVISPIIARMSDARLKQLNAELTKRNVPTVGQQLVEARMSLIRQGMAKQLPTPKFRERLLVMKSLADVVEQILIEFADHPLVAGSADAPEDMAEFERALWDLHVLDNQLLSGERTSSYGIQLSSNLSERMLSNIDAADREVVRRESAQQRLNQVQEADRELAELVAEMRLNRLDYGLQILAEPDLSTEKMMAAYSTALDAQFLLQFLKSREGESEPFSRTSLQEPELVDQIQAKAKEAKELAGDLADKSRLLFEGLHWWLRGRYGSGPDVGGLAKSALTLKQPGALIWLFMPKERPEPTDPLDDRSDPVPKFARRHHYTWAWEDRRVQNKTIFAKTRQEKTNSYKLSTFW